MTPAEQTLQRLDEIDPIVIGPLAIHPLRLAYAAAIPFIERGYAWAKRDLARRVRKQYNLGGEIDTYLAAKEELLGNGDLTGSQQRQGVKLLQQRFIHRMAKKIAKQRRERRIAKRGLYGTFGGHRALFGREAPL